MLLRYGVLAATITLLSTGLVAPAHADTVASDQAQIDKLQEQIEAKGREVEAITKRASEANAHLADINKQIARDEQLLAADDKAEREAKVLVQKVALAAYLGHGDGDESTVAAFQNTDSVTQVASGRHYLNLVNTSWNEAIDKLRLAQDRARQDQAHLVSQQHDAQRAVDLLKRAQSDATKAIDEENASLAKARADLTAAALAKLAEREDEAPTAGPKNNEGRQPVTINLPPPKPVSGGGYANPLRSVGGLTPERIDSGVDYAGSGLVYAVGNGRVVNVYAGDWPGGVFIAYQLTDGPAQGLYVYTAEDINPTVSIGQTVTANTVIGQMFGGPHGIEIGWADGSRIPNAMARSAGQYHGGNSTAFGYNFSRLLQALGAPGGILDNNPTGTLPAGWPQW